MKGKAEIKKFIAKALWFTMPLIIIAYIADIIISNTINKGSEHDSWNYIYSKEGTCELAIFGSSRAIFHFNSKIIEDSLKTKTWNFGMNSANIDLIALRISEYLKNCKVRPNYITLVLDWHNFDYGFNLNRPYQLFPYLLFNKQFYNNLKNFECYKKQYYLLPLIRYTDYIEVYIDKYFKKDNNDNNNSTFNYNGFYNRIQFFNWEEFQNFKEKNFNLAPDYKPNYDKFYLYKEIVNSCKKNNIKLNIVIAPMYYEGQKIVSNYKKTLENFRQWAETDSLPFIDFSNDSIYPINKDTAYFYNCMHLNSKGADKFTSEMYVPYMRELINGSKN